MQHGRDAIAQVLIQWSDSSPELVTWEDLASLQQQFTGASAWEKAVSKEGGIVNSPIRQQISDSEMGQMDEAVGPPRRGEQQMKLLVRLADPVWHR